MEGWMDGGMDGGMDEGMDGLPSCGDLFLKRRINGLSGVPHSSCTFDVMQWDGFISTSHST